MVENRRDQRGVAKGPGECFQWKAKGQCSRRDTCSFQRDEKKRAKSTPKSAPPSEPPKGKDGRNTSRRSSPRGRSPSGKLARQPCRDYIKGNCTRPSCDFCNPPECQCYKKESGCKFGDKCAFVHRQVEDQPSKKPKKMSDKSAVAKLKSARQLGCVLKDIEPQQYSSI